MNRTSFNRIGIPTFLALTVLLTPVTARATGKSLYTRLGGIHGVAAVVDDFVNEFIKTDAVKRVLAGAMRSKRTDIYLFKVNGLKFQLTAFMASAAGGPQKYGGLDMGKAHLGMNLTEKDWSDTVAALQGALNKNKVPAAEQAELVKLVASTKSSIMSSSQKPGSPPPYVPKGTSHYAKLGGYERISAICDDFVNRLATNKLVLANPKTVKSLTSGKVSAAGIKYLLTEQLCQALGGPQKYSGKKMKDSHKELAITEAEWKSVGDDLMQTLYRFRVPQPEIDAIVKIVGGTKKDIVKGK